MSAARDNPTGSIARPIEPLFSESPQHHGEKQDQTPIAMQSPLLSSSPNPTQLPISVSPTQNTRSIYSALASKMKELDHLVHLEGLLAKEEDRTPGIFRMYDCLDKYLNGHLPTASFADILLGDLSFSVNGETPIIPDCEPLKLLREEHPSTGYSSDCFEEDEMSIHARTHKLGFTEAQSLLIDCRVVDPYPNLDNPPSPINLVLMLLDISPDIDFFSLESFISTLKPPPELLKVKFIFYAKKYSVLIQFKYLDIAKRFYQRCKERSRNFEVFLGKHYQTAWATIKTYNRESKMARHYDVQLPIKFFNDDFVGVVVRDLPDQTELREFEHFLKKNGFDRGLEIQQILRYKQCTFCLVILESVSRARKLCRWLNNHKQGKSKLKAHLHPETKKLAPMQYKDLVVSIPLAVEPQEPTLAEIRALSPKFSNLHSETAIYNAAQAIEEVRVRELVARCKGWNTKMLSPLGNRSATNFSSSPIDVMNSPFREQQKNSGDKHLSGNSTQVKPVDSQGPSRSIKASSSGKPASVRRDLNYSQIPSENSRDYRSKDKRRRSHSSESSCESEDSRGGKKYKKDRDRKGRRSPKGHKRRSRSREKSGERTKEGLGENRNREQPIKATFSCRAILREEIQLNVPKTIPELSVCQPPTQNSPVSAQKSQQVAERLNSNVVLAIDQLQAGVPIQQTSNSNLNSEIGARPTELPNNLIVKADRPNTPPLHDAAKPHSPVQLYPEILSAIQNSPTAAKGPEEIDWFDRDIIPEEDREPVSLNSQPQTTLSQAPTIEQPQSSHIDPEIPSTQTADECVTWFDNGPSKHKAQSAQDPPSWKQTSTGVSQIKSPETKWDKVPRDSSVRPPQQHNNSHYRPQRKPEWRRQDSDERRQHYSGGWKQHSHKRY